MLTYEGQSVNGNKTVAMDVTGFLCVSLGSSTVQVHDNLGSNAHCGTLMDRLKAVRLLRKPGKLWTARSQRLDIQRLAAG
jgi:hypothetical protein